MLQINIPLFDIDLKRERTSNDKTICENAIKRKYRKPVCPFSFFLSNFNPDKIKYEDKITIKTDTKNILIPLI